MYKHCSILAYTWTRWFFLKKKINGFDMSFPYHIIITIISIMNLKIPGKIHVDKYASIMSQSLSHIAHQVEDYKYVTKCSILTHISCYAILMVLPTPSDCLICINKVKAFRIEALELKVIWHHEGSSGFPVCSGTLCSSKLSYAIMDLY